MDPLTGGPHDGPPARAETRALLRLQRLPGLGDVGVARLVEAFGSGRAALAAPDAAVAAALGEGEAYPAGLAVARARGAVDEREIDAILARAASASMQVVARGTTCYPDVLLHLHDPPPVLFLRGRPELLALPAVALVGSRAATAYGRRVADRLAAELARRGVAVVSGLALGVDAAAHRGALDAGGATIAVLGSGADVPAPASHRRLFDAIAGRGLLVSEFAPGTEPLPHHFPRRNRIMAALARVVVVVEAARGSGALITARHALDLGRDVMGVPGPIDAPCSAEPNRIIDEGGGMALSAEAVLEVLGGARPRRAAGRVPPPAPDPRPSPPPAAPPPPPGGPDGAVLWTALASAPAGVDELTRRTGLAAARALAALSRLEIEGWAVQWPGARFARRE